MDRILILFLYFLLLVVMYIDINKKIIPNILNFSIFLLCLILSDFKIFFVGAALYTFPIIFFYGYVSDILKKEVFGFGDIKLIMGLSGLLYKPYYPLILQIYIFYLLTFISASLFIFLIFLYEKLKAQRKFSFKNREISFSPFICISFFLLFKFSDYIYGILL